MTEVSFPTRKLDEPMARYDSVKQRKTPAVQVGDILFGRTKNDTVSGVIAAVHGFFTHCAVVTKVDEKGRPLEVSQLYGSGLEIRDYSYFVDEKNGYSSLAIGRIDMDEDMDEDIDEKTLTKLLRAATKGVPDHGDLQISDRLRDLFRIVSFTQDPDPEDPSSGFGYAGVDLALASHLISRMDARSLKPLSEVEGLIEKDGDVIRIRKDDDDIVIEEGGEFRTLEAEYTLSNRQGAGGEANKRFTCSGWVYNVFWEAGLDVMPRMLEHLYRIGQWVFDDETQTFSYSGPAEFSLDDDPDGNNIGSVNALQAFGFSGGLDMRGWHFDATDKRNIEALDVYFGSSKMVDFFKEKLLPRPETLAIVLAIHRLTPFVDDSEAFQVQNIVGPVDLWESPTLDHRFFMDAASEKEYKDYVDQNRRSG